MQIESLKTRYTGPLGSQGWRRQRPDLVQQRDREWVQRLAWLAVLVIPLMQLVVLPVGGKLYGDEAALLIIFVLLLPRHRQYLANDLIHILIALCGLWFIGQFIANWVNDVPALPAVKGLASIGITVTSTLGLIALLSLFDDYPWDPLAVFGLMWGAGYVLEFLIAPQPGESFWEFGGNPGLTFLGVAVLTYLWKKQQRMLTVVGLLSLGVVNLVFVSRALGGACLLTAPMLLCHLLIDRFTRSSPTPLRDKVVMVCVLSALSVVFVLQSYGMAARAGWLGQSNQGTYRNQGNDPFVMILGGRLDLLAAFWSVKERPIVGFGSNRAAPPQMLEGWAHLIRDVGFEPTEMAVYRNNRREGKLIAHSYVFGSWAEAGVLALPFWLWVGGLAITVFVRLKPNQQWLAPLIIFIVIKLAWDMLFSPYATTARRLLPFELALLMVTFEWQRLHLTGARTDAEA
jgi:hypothetical protein